MSIINKGTYPCCEGCAFKVEDYGLAECEYSDREICNSITIDKDYELVCTKLEATTPNYIKELTLGILDYVEVELDDDDLIDFYDEVHSAEEGSCDFTIKMPYTSIEVRVIHENSVDGKWEEGLEEMLQNCYDIPKYLENYIDYDKWVSDAKMDGMGNYFNPYDGSEKQVGSFYLFRTN